MTSRIRPLPLALGGALLAALIGLALALASTGPARGKGQAVHPQAPSPEVRAMLRRIDPGRVRRDIRTLVSFGTRSTISAQDDPNRGVGAARDWIFAELKRYAARSDGRLQVELQSYVQPPAERIPSSTRITNVVATLQGTQPESTGRTYVVSGHYDSRCTDVLDTQCDAPGADDDASGVAAMLEMARVMSRHRFDATIVFMAVAGEEQGLYGSDFFATQAKQQGRDIEGMLDNDIIGSSTGDRGQREPHTIRLFSEGVPTSETEAQADVRRSIGGEDDGPSRQLARFVKDVAENRATGMQVRLINRRDRYLRGGDQISFLENGYPAVRFTEPNENYAHQHQDVRVENGVQFGDLLRFVDFGFTARVARVNAATLAALANGPRSPVDARVVTAELTNDTELTWKPNPEPDLAGYEIVYRETTEPLWTHVIRIGNVTDHTVEGLSKDNFQFGVRAVDRDGNRSPVSFPLPSE
jgi:Peptidase family M28/Fibronectin type III domain